MILSDKNIVDFQNIFKENFGEEISREETYTQAVKLINLVRATYKPMTHEEYELIEARKK